MKVLAQLAMVTVVLGLGISEASAETKDAEHAAAPATGEAIFTNYKDVKWNRIIPDLDGSPEIAILHVDPRTQATKLLIRTPKGIHVRKHWHSANETHTVITGDPIFACDGKRVEQHPGSFNYLPAKMVHEAWVPAGGLVFITVDGPWDVNWVEGAPTAADLIKPSRPVHRHAR